MFSFENCVIRFIGSVYGENFKVDETFALRLILFIIFFFSFLLPFWSKDRVKETFS